MNTNTYRDDPERMDDHDLQDVHDVTLGVDGGGGASLKSRSASNSGSSGVKWYKKSWFVGMMVMVVIAVVITIIVLLVGGDDGEDSSPVGISLPAPEVPLSELQQNHKDLMAVLVPEYTERGLDTKELNSTQSFQGRAAEYVAGMSSFKLMQPTQRVEMYAIVVFYLSTFRQPHLLNPLAGAWSRSEHWISKTELCLWEGIECNENESVVGIVLPDNDMSGTLPLELSLLESLAKLDFSSNLLYMDEESHALWTILPNLKELIMDDNFFISETGIPAEFASLTSVEKVSLSFNLLQGVFNEKTFSTMVNLVHFEAESNYIGGSLPSTLLTLPYLTYIYLRRNSLEFDLSSLTQSGYLPSIFAIWLDGNTIKGKIPTTIGQFTGLASLSVTDASLTGPIPTEMGLLTDLQRLWLYGNSLEGPIPTEAAAAWTKLEVFEVYDNDLIGVMPETVCSVIGNSTYELKSLYADCEEVTCKCCTDCN